MKKILIIFILLFFTKNFCNADSSIVIKNYKASEAKNNIIKYYILNGQRLYSNDDKTGSFTVSDVYSNSVFTVLIKRTYNVVQNGSDCIISINTNRKYNNDDDTLKAIKQLLEGYYSYGVYYHNKIIKIKDKDKSSPETILSPEIASGGITVLKTALDAKKQGLVAGDKIIQINGTLVTNMNNQNVFNDTTRKDDSLILIYKRGNFEKEIKLKPSFVKMIDGKMVEVNNSL